MTRMQLIRTLASWRPDLTAYRGVESAYRIGFKSLARRYLELQDEVADLDVVIGAIVDELAPNLVARNSIGQTVAAQLLLTAVDNPERLRSEARFAELCGVSPIRASSGKTFRHRLNSGGDRAATSALHISAIGRLRRPKDQALHRSSNRRRAFRTRRQSSPKTISCKRGLHTHHAASEGNQRHSNRRLTNRRASGAAII
jgi:transposase